MESNSWRAWEELGKYIQFSLNLGFWQLELVTRPNLNFPQLYSGMLRQAAELGAEAVVRYEGEYLSYEKGIPVRSSRLPLDTLRRQSDLIVEKIASTSDPDL